MARPVSLLAGLFAALFVLGGCKTAPKPVAGQFTELDEAALEEVNSVLAEAVGRAQFELGPEGLIGTSSITVLPPPLGPNETRSPALPEVFGILKRGDACMLFRIRDSEIYPLSMAKCEPVSP